jgi:hypothetical protein
VDPAPLSVALTDEPPEAELEPVEELLLLLPQAARPVASAQAARAAGRIRVVISVESFERVVARQADAATDPSCYRDVVEL